MTFPDTEVRADVGGEADDATVIAESLARPERFAVIFDRYFAEVHRYAERRLGTEAADEIASDTFLAAFGKRDRYRPGEPTTTRWRRGSAHSSAVPSSPARWPRCPGANGTSCCSSPSPSSATRKWRRRSASPMAGDDDLRPDGFRPWALAARAARGGP